MEGRPTNDDPRRASSFVAVAIALGLLAGCEYDPFVALCRRPEKTKALVKEDTAPSVFIEAQSAEPPPKARRGGGGVVLSRLRTVPDIVTVTPTMLLGEPPVAKLQPIDADEPAPKIEVHRIELASLPERAGVGQTIVAVARLTNADGKPVSDIDVEWMLDRAGAGAIVAVGGSPSTNLEEIRTPEYAQARTSATTYRLDSVVGSNDPVAIEPGASWCVLRTERAGPMVLTARSRDIEQTSQSQVVHRLHWIEAKLQLETPIESSSPYQTTVKGRVQTETGEPLAGYPVFFAVEDESASVVGGGRANQCVSDSAGLVTVDLLHAVDSAGATALTATLFAPPEPVGQPVELERRAIEVRWPERTANIVVQAPAIAKVGSIVLVTAEVEINASASGEQASIAAVVGMGLEAPRLAPDSTDENGVRFVLARLDGEKSTATELTVTSRQPGERMVRFEVRDKQRLLAQREAVIRFVEPLATVEKRFPKDWRIGMSASYTVVARNPGLVPLDELVVEDEIPPGLRVDESSGVRFVDRIRWEVARLMPGEEKSFEVRATPTALFTGLAVRAWAKEPLSSTAEGYDQLNVSGVETVELAIEDLSDPVRVNGEAEYLIHLINRGTSPARDVRLTPEVSSELRILSAKGTLVSEVVSGELRLGPVTVLEPGQELFCRLRATATKEGDARIAVRVMHSSLGDDGVLRSESTHIYKGARGEE